MWAWLGTVPPLPLNTVTAAFLAVYLCPVFLWLGSESYFVYSKLRSVIQTVAKNKNPQTLLVILALARRQANDWHVQTFIYCFARPPKIFGGSADSAIVSMPLKTVWIIHIHLSAAIPTKLMTNPKNNDIILYLCFQVLQ